MGGGDVNISAGNDITRLSAAVPTYLTYDEQTSTRFRYGSGNLEISAGGDIQSGSFFAGDGDINVFSGGNITTDNTSRELSAAFAVMGGNVNVTSKGNN